MHCGRHLVQLEQLFVNARDALSQLRMFGGGMLADLTAEQVGNQAGAVHHFVEGIAARLNAVVGLGRSRPAVR